MKCQLDYPTTDAIQQYLSAGDDTAALPVNHTHRCTAGFHTTALTDCLKYSTIHNAVAFSYLLGCCLVC